ncbi:hypothetical protein CR513_52067, partial [Mucuna pruriens]
MSIGFRLDVTTRWNSIYLILESAIKYERTFDIFKMIAHLVRNEGGERKCIKKKFDKYWKEYSIMLAFGVILDPRLKDNFIKYCYTKLDPLTSKDKTKNYERTNEKKFPTISIMAQDVLSIFITTLALKNWLHGFFQNSSGKISHYNIL